MINTLVEKILGKLDYNYPEHKALRVSTLLFYQAIIVSFVFIPFHYFLAGPKLLVISLFVFLGSVFSLIIMKLRYFNSAKLFFIIISNLAILINSRLVGVPAGIHYFFAPTISLPFFMFNISKNMKEIIFSVMFPMFCAMMLVAGQPSFIELQAINQGLVRYYAGISALLSLGMLAFSTFYFHSIINEGEKEIFEKNQMIFQSEKMVSLGILASGVAHEINNPLSVLKMGCDYFKKQLANSDVDPDILLKLDKMNSNIDRISKIVKSLKSYSRNESLDEVSEINLQNILDESFVLLTKEFSIVQIEFGVDLHTNPIMVKGHESELIQVFVNLLKNAIDAIKMNDTKKWIKLKSRVVEGDIELSFIDSGFGISEENLKKIFSPFYTTKGIGEGTGLGLYISKNLIESMGGSLFYQEYNGHTSFVIRLKSV
jgi:signal transduction histidine kinase